MRLTTEVIILEPVNDTLTFEALVSECILIARDRAARVRLTHSGVEVEFAQDSDASERCEYHRQQKAAVKAPSLEERIVMLEDQVKQLLTASSHP